MVNNHDSFSVLSRTNDFFCVVFIYVFLLFLAILFSILFLLCFFFYFWFAPLFSCCGDCLQFYTHMITKLFPKYCKRTNVRLCAWSTVTVLDLSVKRIFSLFYVSFYHLLWLLLLLLTLSHWFPFDRMACCRATYNLNTLFNWFVVSDGSVAMWKFLLYSFMMPMPALLVAVAVVLHVQILLYMLVFFSAFQPLPHIIWRRDFFLHTQQQWILYGAPSIFIYIWWFDDKIMPKICMK